MRKFLGTLVIVGFIVAGAGFYREWFDLSASHRPGQTNIELTIDKDRIRRDANAASARAHQLAARSRQLADQIVSD